jgi:hypothetical protein
MKKLLVAFALLTLVSFSFSGCGEDKEATDVEDTTNGTDVIIPDEVEVTVESTTDSSSEDAVEDASEDAEG